jgi:hypothetical protein
MTYYSDYPSKPIGGGNPYYACSHCGRSDPEINGRLEGHEPNCAYRIAKQAELPSKGIVIKTTPNKPTKIVTVLTKPSHRLPRSAR